jgi:TolB-like protein/DNA-binding winged helix-turn-helix (wHTH) protein/Flp pilus assembly protein TadD
VVGRWRFGRVLLDEARAQLWVDERPVALERACLELLSYLLRHPGEKVDKDTLLRVGWPGRVVSENSLAKAISKLRHALDDADGSLLQVVHGYGYRLAWPAERIEALHESSEPHAPAAASASPARRPATRTPVRWFAGLVLALTAGAALLAGWLHWQKAPSSDPPARPVPRMTAIAVLPFLDLSPQRDQGYFADGLAEQLLDNLAQLPELNVVARTSSFAYRNTSLSAQEIGRKLGATMVLEGSVRMSGERLRITTQLIDARNGYHLWSRTYDRPLQELFDLQDEITRSVVAALKIEFSPQRDKFRHATRNPEAYRQLLLARSLPGLDETSGRQRIQALRNAVNLDPGYVEAWLALANQLNYDGLYQDSRDEAQAGKREALAILDRLVAEFPRRTDVRLMRGDARFWSRRDMTGAEQDFAAARSPDPAVEAERQVKLARLYAATGRMAQALASTERALQLQPTLDSALTVRGYHLLASTRFADARKVLAQGSSLSPEQPHYHYYLGLCDLLQGAARASLADFDNSHPVFRLSGTAAARWTLGERAAADEALQSLTRRYGHISRYEIGQVHAWRGEPDQAFAWLQRSVAGHEASVMYLPFDPMLRSLHGDPRWAELLRSAGLSRTGPTASKRE